MCRSTWYQHTKSVINSICQYCKEMCMLHIPVHIEILYRLNLTLKILLWKISPWKYPINQPLSQDEKFSGFMAGGESGLLCRMHPNIWRFWRGVQCTVYTGDDFWSNLTVEGVRLSFLKDGHLWYRDFCQPRNLPKVAMITWSDDQWCRDNLSSMY